MMDWMGAAEIQIRMEGGAGQTLTGKKPSGRMAINNTKECALLSTSASGRTIRTAGTYSSYF
jgi:hypothetical protein